MDNFRLYAHYYDLLYKDKEYSNEVEYILGLLRSKKSSVSKILELGCGTGVHADLFAKHGIMVDGIDLSEQMIDLANKKYGSNENLSFVVGDLTTYSSGKKYDVVLSLFHVMSYQNENDELIAAINTASDHLNAGGIFIFDFWYGPGVLTNLPEIRTKKMHNNEISLRRQAIPKIHGNRNVVDVNYTIDITQNESGQIHQIYEKHSLRYLFEPELEYYLKLNNFKIIGFYEWLTTEMPDFDTWNAVLMAEKV
ncbi:class I SAM-dependent methyltransferase [Aureitalea sp. L0-47]|uniref:class I SAM-dependent DNA methyltransferase n=1 Tax=Aureitalea sp. L0-47 TaxID=2816962 RepID=UPI0022380635|nr:class I SAM-dependent methyltransferase [Aureitalea sp. L0-47]MCW5519193.1 class I SAM-dependent methyltransferase [Aureitalea sp. L0-47]